MTSPASDSRQSASEPAQDLPFQVVIRPQPGESAMIMSPDDEMASMDEIEAAYLRALESTDLAESRVLTELEGLSEKCSPDGLLESAESALPSLSTAEEHSTELLESSLPSESDTEDAQQPRTSVEQVVEALLFVGGGPLLVKKILDVLGGTHSPEQIEQILETLNTRYQAQHRPYEIRLVEGGYQLSLVSEYESLRARAYGHGPKEVKLAQDVLELLALIAYQQPVTRTNLEESGKQNVPGLLRQLLRRELIRVDRTDPEIGECYRTTPRFLELFGLSSLEDLPQAGTFQFK